MKRNYIKPMMELLDGGSEKILCASPTSGSTGWGTNTGGSTTPISGGEPDPNGAREYDDDFDFDE